MSKKLIFMLFVGMLSLTFVGSAFAQHDYSGIKSCKMCHKGEKKGMIYEKWAGEKHSTATETIITEGEGENAKCLGCHSTGYGKGGYDPAAENKAQFAGVTCEACHGAGKDYKKMSVMKDHDASVAAGLVIPTEETCTGCHNNSHHEDMTFDFAKQWEQIKHEIPAAEGE